MFYLVGGAPRSGKSILGQQVAARLQIGWISTDLLLEMLRLKQVEGVKSEWDATPAAIQQAAGWFYPVLERFLWGLSPMTDAYLVEGVDFLPEQVARLSAKYPVKSVFLGCSQMTLARFDRFPGRSCGYAALPQETRRQFAEDVTRWSEFVRQEAERTGYPYIDMSHDFSARLSQAETLLLGV